MTTYRDFSVETPEYKPMEFYSSDSDDEEELADWLSQQDIYQETVEEPEIPAGEEVIG